MNGMIEHLSNKELWTISVQLLVLYVVSVVIFLGAHAINLKVTSSQKDAVSKGKAAASALVFILSLVANALGVATLAFLARKTGETPRMAMVAVPLFLVIEKHVRAMRADPQDKRFNLLAAAGVALGMVGAVFAFMPHAPLK